MAQEACGNRVCLIRRVPHRSEHCLPWPLERLPLKVHVPLLELFAAFKTACFAHWLVSVGVSSPGPALNARLTALTPAVLAYLKGSSRLASLGRFTPLGALALSSTMPVAVYPPISTAGLNIYVLDLVLLYLGCSLALLFNGPGRLSFDAAMVPALLDDLSADHDSDPEAASPAGALLVSVPVELNRSNKA